MNWIRVILSLASQSEAQIGSGECSAVHRDWTKERHVAGLPHILLQIRSQRAGFAYGLWGA
jgi:hypothetical protein